MCLNPNRKELKVTYISHISVDTKIRNAVANWTNPDFFSYDFNNEPRPDWLIRDKVKGGTRVRARFPACPPALATKIDNRAFGSQISRACKEGKSNRVMLAESLPGIIQALEEAGYGEHEYTDQLRQVQYFAQMWLTDEPEIEWEKEAGGEFKFTYYGTVLYDLKQ